MFRAAALRAPLHHEAGSAGRVAKNYVVAAAGTISPVIGRRVTMGEAGKALDEHEARRAIGRTVVVVA